MDRVSWRSPSKNAVGSLIAIRSRLDRSALYSSGLKKGYEGTLYSCTAAVWVLLWPRSALLDSILILILQLDFDFDSDSLI